MFPFRPPAPRVRGAAVLGPVGGEDTSSLTQAPLSRSQRAITQSGGGGAFTQLKGTTRSPGLVLGAAVGVQWRPCAPPIAASLTSPSSPLPPATQLASQQAARPVQNATLWWPCRYSAIWVRLFECGGEQVRCSSFEVSDARNRIDSVQVASHTFSEPSCTGNCSRLRAGPETRRAAPPRGGYVQGQSVVYIIKA